MQRPYVQLSSENKIEGLLKALETSLHHFTRLNGVVGVILDGGLSRGYGDHLSEIDILIYVREKEFLEYKEGICPFALGITMIDGYLYDIKLVNFEQELEKKMNSIELWDLSYATILYDPEGKIADLIKRGLSEPVQISSASRLLWDAYWHYRLAGDIWIHRQDGLQGHFVLNHAIKPLISALFVVNQEHIPHDKWLVHMSRSLPQKQDNWDAVLIGIMNTGDCSVQSLIDRQQWIDQLWSWINQQCCEMSDFYRDLDFVQKQSFESLRKLIQKSEYTIEEWSSIQSLESLNYEPTHSIFQRKGDRIVLNKGRLLSLRPEDMYKWMYRIADEVRKEL